MLFKKKNNHHIEKKSYDKETKRPVLKCSICTGEQVAGFQDKKTGKFEDIMLVRSPAEIELFRETYDITGEIKKIY